MLGFPFCFWFRSERHALLMRSPSGCRGTQMFFFFLFAFGFNPRGTHDYCAAVRDAGERKICFFLFDFCFNPRGTHCYCAALRDAGESAGTKPIKSIGLRMHGLGQCRVMGLGFARTPSSKMQGLANRCDRFKNARTRIVQGSWDQGLRARCS